MENNILIVAIAIPSIIIIVILAFMLGGRKKTKVAPDSTLDYLPNFPIQCKLYFDLKTGSECRRCASVGKESEIQVRRRYLLFKDENGVLKHKRLAFLYSCPGCGYKSLDKLIP